MSGKGFVAGTIRQLDLDKRVGRFLSDSGNQHKFHYGSELDEKMKECFIHTGMCELFWNRYSVATGIRVTDAMRITKEGGT